MKSAFFAAKDGIRLHFVDSGFVSMREPLLCLAGLTRNCRDFEPVFGLLENQRRVVALDFRGRGKSQFADSRTYTAKQELEDTLVLLDQLELDHVCVLGTSRGGIVGMLMGAFAQERISGLLLNDVGPALEADAVHRIGDYVGKTFEYENWDAAALAISTVARGFEDVDHAQWLRAAQRMFVEKDGKPHSSHDPRLADTFPKPGDPLTDLWPIFEAVGSFPVGIMRGSGSDLLSGETVEEMKRLRNDLLITEIPKRGHVPFLDEPESVQMIRLFLDNVDQARGRRTLLTN